MERFPLTTALNTPKFSPPAARSPRSSKSQIRQNKGGVSQKGGSVTRMKTLPPIFKHPSDRFERFSNIPFFPRIASNIPPNGFQTSLPFSNIPRHFSNLASDNFKHPSDRFQTSLSDLRPSLESPGIIQIEAVFQTSLRFSNIPWVQTSLPSLKFQRSLP